MVEKTKARKTEDSPLDWKSSSPEVLLETLAELVHFSVKTVNSNIPAGGVRLASSEGLKLPYVSVRTLMPHAVALELDYTANAGSTATWVKQINAFVRKAPTTPVPPGEAQAITQGWAQIAAGHHEVGLESLSPRLRQLLLPRAGGAYVAVSPLGSGSLGRYWRQKVAAHDDARKATRPDPDEPHAKQTEGTPSGMAPYRTLRRAVFGIGGSNPQNVGATVRDLQHPLVFSAPKREADLQAAWRRFHQGVSFVIPHNLLEDYAAFRVKCKAANGGGMPTNQRTREAEKQHIQTIGRVLLQRADAARHLLLTQRKRLPPAKQLGSDALTTLQKGALNPELRGPDWWYDWADEVARRVVSQELSAGGGIEMDQSGIQSLIGWLRELMR